jgi:DNA-binding LacI/PurR family transcriptional regulator
MSKITIKDVAKLAGVSPSSVSNVVNGRMNKCSAETRNKILHAMNELNYRPNLTAKSLVTKKSNLIGVIYKSNGNFSFEETIKGIEFYLRTDEDYDYITMEYTSLPLVEEWIMKRNLDGILLLGDFDNNKISHIETFNRPIVCIDNYRETLSNISYVNSEDTFGAYLATESLIEKGVKRPCFISSKLEEDEVSNRRYLGYMSALEDYGIKFEYYMLIEVEKVDFLQGKLIGARLKEVEGGVCAHDLLALGILKTLFINNIKCPEDIKIIGFENIPGSEYTNPALTSIDIKSFEKGQKATEVLLKRIDGIKVEKNEVNIEIELILRETI